MTLRGRLTTAFLAVVLGPVLLGAAFVGMTVAAVSGDRAGVRLDHAATTVRTAIGAVCGQLQAAADAVAVLPDDAARRAAADQLVARGVAAAVRVTGPDADVGTPDAPAQPWADCAATGSAAAEPAGAIAAQAEIRDTDGALVGTAEAALALDAAFVDRLARTGGAEVTALGAGAGRLSTEPADRVDGVVAAADGARQAPGGRQVRLLGPGPGQPLTLVVSTPGAGPDGLYALLLAAVIGAGGLGVLVARWLARSTTRSLAEVAHAADRVAGGDLTARVPAGPPDEVGMLAASFNRMTRELQGYVQALTASRDQLRRHLSILGDTLSSTHDLHRILRVILDTAVAATGARAGAVLLADPATGTLVGQAADGLAGRWDGDDVTTLRLPIGSGLIGTVAATGEPRHGRLVDGPAPADGEPRGETWMAVPICAPKLVGDPLVPGAAAEPPPAGASVVLGVLALYDRLGADEFTDSDLDTLRTFAGQAGVAVNNVRVHEEAQRLSLTDPLTGLWNYRYLQESSRREVERASRFGRMLCVLALDLDHFKDVNDQYGHAAGDAVLCEFATRMRGCLREVDLAFRQGGEEFVVLLPETDAFGGATVAERLGAAVRSAGVDIGVRRGGGQQRVAVSVSIGIAVYPDHGVTAGELLEAADDALYAAKAGGRDTYRLAEVTGDLAGQAAAVPPGPGAPGGPQPPRARRGR